MERTAPGITTALAAMGIALPTLLACNQHPLKDVEYVNQEEGKATVQINPNKDVDILFVVDNSGSMGEEQATLAENFGAFIEVLEAEDVNANYRIGVTTTDNGNPMCSGTTPEGGALVMRTCQDRLEEFVFRPGDPDEVDRRFEACENLCPAEFAGFEVTPTELQRGGASEQRPWLQRLEGESNLPDGMSTVQGFQCFGPQGINGCGFESPLESMYKALSRAYADGEASYGFIRDDALLGVVFVTDEADCSYRSEHADIFLPDGDRAFWEDASSSYPTSAVCWNAGVACEGGPGTYDTCEPENFAADGTPGASEDDAVLHPLSRYTEFLEQIRADKQGDTGKDKVLVSVIAGVPGGYPDQGISYQDSADAGFQGDFGIGPGCSSVAGEAVPPVRLRELAEAVNTTGEPSMFSICNSSYTDALEQIAGRIRDNLEPACMPMCVRDMDPSTPELDTSCVLNEEVGTSDPRPIPRCVQDGGQWSLPTGAQDCYYELTGAERDDDCIDEGWNLEFKLLRAPGTLPAPDSVIKATCERSQNEAVDCPDL